MAVSIDVAPWVADASAKGEDPRGQLREAQGDDAGALDNYRRRTRSTAAGSSGGCSWTPRRPDSTNV
jgi:hypothetical protein